MPHRVANQFVDTFTGGVKHLYGIGDGPNGLTDLLRHHGEAAALLAGADRLDPGVERQHLQGAQDLDAIRRQGKLEWVHVWHEEVAPSAASAEAQLMGEIAFCAGICGLGNLHLINRLFDGHRSRIPALGIAAYISSAEIESGYFTCRLRSRSRSAERKK